MIFCFYRCGKLNTKLQILKQTVKTGNSTCGLTEANASFQSYKSVASLSVLDSSAHDSQASFGRVSSITKSFPVSSFNCVKIIISNCINLKRGGLEYDRVIRSLAH